MRITAENTLGAEVGDQVEVIVEPGHVLKGSILVFLFPLLMMVLGYLVGQQLTLSENEGPGILGSIVGLVLAFMVLRWTNRSNKANPAKITAYAQRK